jgi:hypothetical protein
VLVGDEPSRDCAMNQDSKLTRGFYFAPDPRPSSNDTVIFECVKCKMTLTRRKGDSSPYSTDGGPCPKGGTHSWFKK